MMVGDNRHYMTERERMVADASGYLRRARDLLARAGAKRAADKVRLALKSAEGAQRHAKSKRYEP